MRQRFLLAAAFVLGSALGLAPLRAQQNFVTINGVSYVPYLGFVPRSSVGPTIEGVAYYDSTTHAYRYYNGTADTALGGSNPFSDATALVKNATDTTKLALFSAASITTGTTRTYTLPNSSGTFWTSGATAQTYAGGSVWKPSADSTTALCFDKADGTTAVLCLDTTNGTAVLGAGTLANPALTLGAAPWGFYRVGSELRYTSTGANAHFAMSGAQDIFYIRNGGVYAWSSDATSGGTADTGIGRNATTAGMAEVNNGTLGTIRDLLTRSLATGTATYGAAPIGTVASGTGITVNATGDVRTVTNKVTLTNAAFSAAATTADATIYTLAAKQKLVDIYADVTQVFSGGAVSAATMTCGITAGGNTILVSFDVKTATIQRGLADADLGTALTRATAIQGGYLPSWSATTTITCRMTTVTANTNALTQGSITFYLTTRAF